MSVAELEIEAPGSYAPNRNTPRSLSPTTRSHLSVAPQSSPALSTREIEVLLTWMAAESKEDAANRLFISQSTVSTHISRIRAKYAAVGRPANTKAHLFARALQDGYTTLEAW